MNMRNVYIRKSSSLYWEDANEMWNFYKEVCISNEKDYSEISFIKILSDMGYEVKNLDDGPSVVDYLRVGQKIEAIKRFKELNHCSLLDAKNEVEKLLDKYWDNMEG